MVDQSADGPPLDGPPDKVVAVKILPLDSHKEAAGRHLPGIGTDARHLPVHGAGNFQRLGDFADGQFFHWVVPTFIAVYSKDTQLADYAVMESCPLCGIQSLLGLKEVEKGRSIRGLIGC